MTPTADPDEPRRPPLPGTLAHRLLVLFEEYNASSETKLTSKSLARAIREQKGTISHKTISDILNGVTTNPSLNTLREIAGWFGADTARLTADQHAPPGCAGERLGRRLREVLAARPEDQRPSMEDISEALAADGVRVTPKFLTKLFAGTAAEANVGTVSAVARYFGVGVGELLDDDATRNQAQLNRVLLRATSELSPKGLAAVTLMVESVLDLQDEPNSARHNGGSNDGDAARPPSG